MTNPLQRLWQRGRSWLLRARPRNLLMPSAEPAMQRGQFTLGDQTLDWHLYVPPGDVGSPRPLLLMLHGCTQDGAQFAAATGMNRHARGAGVLVLYPTQSESANSQRCWNWFQPQHKPRTNGEPALLAALVRDTMARHAVDPARIYVAGLSAGASMADVLAQREPALFAAVGIYAGVMAGAAQGVLSALAVMKHASAVPLSIVLAARPRRPVPMIVFQGDADSTVNPRNAERLVQASLGGDDNDEQKRSGTAPGGVRYTVQHFDAKPERAEIEFWLLHGAGHAWSGGASGPFSESSGPDASAQMLRFLLSHRNPLEQA